MKTLWMIVMIIACIPGAEALPIMNQNSPGAENINIFPDHEKKNNFFYYGPNKLSMAYDEMSTPLFTYIEHKTRFARRAIVQVVMRPSFHQKDLDAAKMRVCSIYPNASFAALSFTSAKMLISSEFEELVESSDCNHLAGNVADDQTCVLSLSPRGRSVILNALRSPSGIAVHFVYQVRGVLDDGNGTFTAQDLAFNVSGRIGGSELKSFPRLFLDPWNNPIEFFDEP